MLLGHFHVRLGFALDNRSVMAKYIDNGRRSEPIAMTGKFWSFDEESMIEGKTMRTNRTQVFEENRSVLVLLKVPSIVGAAKLSTIRKYAELASIG